MIFCFAIQRLLANLRWVASEAGRVSWLFLNVQREAQVATHDEVLTMIEKHCVFSMGIGYTDAQLLASVLLDRRTSLWTRDERLKVAAEKVGARLYQPLNN